MIENLNHLQLLRHDKETVVVGLHAKEFGCLRLLNQVTVEQAFVVLMIIV